MSQTLESPPQQTLMSFASGITSQEWDWVHRLIADVQAHEKHEHLISMWAQWRMAVRQFRQTEFQLMRKRTPTEIDYRFHRTCLAALMSIGEFLLLQTEGESDRAALERLGLSIENTKASLQTLRLNWEEWHSTSSNSTRIAELESKVAAFNGQARPH